MASYLPSIGGSPQQKKPTTAASSSPVTSSGQINPNPESGGQYAAPQQTTRPMQTMQKQPGSPYESDTFGGGAPAPTGQYTQPGEQWQQFSQPAPTTQWGPGGPFANMTTPGAAMETGGSTTQQPMDPQQALSNIQSYAQSKYGRQLTQQELQQLMAAVGYQGQPVTQALMNQVIGLIDWYAKGGAPGSQPGAPPAGGAEPFTGQNPLNDPNTGQPVGMGWDPVTGTMGGGGSPYVPSGWSGTPEQAIGAINDRLARYGLKPLTQAQIQGIIQAVGYQGGNVTGDQYNAAIDYLMKQYGVDPKQPPGPSGPPDGGGGGGGGGGNGGDDPIYKPGTAPERKTGYYAGYNFDRTGLPTYQAYQYGTNAPNAPGAFNFNTPTPDAYKAGTITQFGGVPGLQQTQGYSNQLLNNLLQNPLSMTDQGVAQLKEANKEQSLDMRQQLQDQLGLSNAARGTFGGGYQEASQRRLGENMAADVMQSNRAIDIQKMLQDKQDVLSALGIGEQAMSGQANRAMGLYNTGLQGQMSQQALNQAAAQSALNRAQFQLGQQGMQATENNNAFQRAMQNALFGFNKEQAQAQQNLLQQQSGADAVRYQNAIDQLQATHNLATHGANMGVDQFDLNRFLAQEQLNQAGIQSQFQNREANRAYGLSQQDMARLNRALDIQKQLGLGGLDIDRARIGESGRQFDLGYILNLMQFLESQRQFNAGQGFDWSQLQNLVNNGATNTLLGL